MIIQDKLREFIDLYKKQVEVIGLAVHVGKERYKFDHVSTFQEKFDLEVDDLSQMIEESLPNNNLTLGMNYYPRGVLINFARESKKETRDALRKLFDENAPVEKRIDEFNDTFELMMGRRNKENGRHDITYFGLRFISLLLATRFPEKYFPTKPRETSGFVTFIDPEFKMTRQVANGGRYKIYEKYFLELRKALQEDVGIEKIHSSLTETTKFKDSGYIWMTQEVVFASARLLRSERITSTASADDAAGQGGSPAELLNLKKQIILYGPPGTGKTYTARNLCVSFLENESYDKK